MVGETSRGGGCTTPLSIPPAHQHPSCLRHVSFATEVVSAMWSVRARCHCRHRRFRLRFKGTLLLLRKENFEIAASYHFAPWRKPTPTLAVVDTAAGPSAIRVDIVGGSAIELLWLLSGDLGATQCGAPSKPQPTTWNGRSGIWRQNYSVRMACPTAKTTRIKLTRPSPRLAYHCNDAISRIQEGLRPRCTQARSLSARDSEDGGRPASSSEVDLDARP